MGKTSIEWTKSSDGTPGYTWNPTTGCDRVSPGCDNCYALRQSARLKLMGSPKYQTDGRAETSGPGFGLATHTTELHKPFTWNHPHRVFVNSMSDLFHDAVDRYFLVEVFAVMARTPQHTYQILTKRHARMRSIVGARSFAGEVTALIEQSTIPWPLPNVWLGVSAEDQKWANTRIPSLLDTPAAVRFVSAEPLLGPIRMTRFLHGPTRLDWVITGGESGPDHRPFDEGWARSIRDECNLARVAFFHKQHGGARPKSGGRVLDGRTWDEMPGGAEVGA
jgi:protein gp37